MQNHLLISMWRIHVFESELRIWKTHCIKKASADHELQHFCGIIFSQISQDVGIFSWNSFRHNAKLLCILWLFLLYIWNYLSVCSAQINQGIEIPWTNLSVFQNTDHPYFRHGQIAKTICTEVVAVELEISSKYRSCHGSSPRWVFKDLKRRVGMLSTHGPTDHISGLAHS